MQSNIECAIYAANTRILRICCILKISAWTSSHKYQWSYEGNFNVKNTFNNEKLKCVIEIQRRKQIGMLGCTVLTSMDNAGNMLNDPCHGHVEV